NNEDEVHRKKLEEIREACLRIRAECLRPRSLEEDARYKKALEQLSAALARQGNEREELQSEIDALVVTDNTKVAELDQKISNAERTVTEARKSLRSATDTNQIYRLAASWYGVSTSNVTEEQFAFARLVFATFSAVAVALAGSIAALVYYARSRVPGAPSLFVELMTKVARARRAYYARLRKTVVREVPVVREVYRDGKEPPIVIEKP